MRCADAVPQPVLQGVDSYEYGVSWCEEVFGLPVPRPLPCQLAPVREHEARGCLGTRGIECDRRCGHARYVRKRCSVQGDRCRCVELRWCGRDVRVIQAQFPPDRHLDAGCDRLGVHEVLLHVDRIADVVGSEVGHHAIAQSEAARRTCQARQPRRGRSEAKRLDWFEGRPKITSRDGPETPHASSPWHVCRLTTPASWKL